VTIAVLRQLVGDGRLDPAKETVVLSTGEGLKTLDPLLPVVGPTHRVDPSLKSARAAGLIS
jgi:threonine synthase